MFQIHVGRKTDAPRALPDIAFRWLDGRGRGHSRRRGNWSALLRDRDARRIRADAKRIRADARRIRADAKRLVKQRQDAGALRLFSLPAIPNESARRTSTMRRLATVLILAAGAAALVRITVVPWARSWGRVADDSGPLPGDDLVDEATAIETRGIDINATPDEVWPWLVQMGYGRAGWYSYDALDMNMPSTKVIRPELAELKVGDVMPTHPGGGFLVRVLDAPKALVLYSDTELVRTQAEEADADEAVAGPVNIRATGCLPGECAARGLRRLVGVRSRADGQRHDPPDRALPRSVRGGRSALARRHDAGHGLRGVRDDAQADARHPGARRALGPCPPGARRAGGRFLILA